MSYPATLFRTWADGDEFTGPDITDTLQQIVTDLVPSKIDDASTDVTAMQTTADPYVGGTATVATTLEGELQRLRHVVKVLAGWTQWYAHSEVPVLGSGGAGIKIGNATPTAITNIRVYTPALTPAAIAAASVSEQTFAVAGLTTADKVLVNGPAPGTNPPAVHARVSTADTLAVTFINPTAGTATPTSGTFSVVAIRS